MSLSSWYSCFLGNLCCESVGTSAMYAITGAGWADTLSFYTRPSQSYLFRTPSCDQDVLELNTQSTTMSLKTTCVERQRRLWRETHSYLSVWHTVVPSQIMHFDQDVFEPNRKTLSGLNMFWPRRIRPIEILCKDQDVWEEKKIHICQSGITLDLPVNELETFTNNYGGGFKLRQKNFNQFIVRHSRIIRHVGMSPCHVGMSTCCRSTFELQHSAYNF